MPVTRISDIQDVSALEVPEGRGGSAGYHGTGGACGELRMEVLVDVRILQEDCAETRMYTSGLGDCGVQGRLNPILTKNLVYGAARQRVTFSDARNLFNTTV